MKPVLTLQNTKRLLTFPSTKTKHVLINCLLMVFTTIVFAQSNNINYKALIKDGSGNVVANQNITVQFSILKGVAETNVYTETHNTMTDDNGLVILKIGEGTTTDIFADIDWGSDDHSLNVQIDITGGTTYTDMGTTQFMAVPYAISAANVTGLEALNEGNGIGWRLKNQDPNNYGNIGLNAVDLSYSGSAFLRGATGGYSLATGFNTTAFGGSSSAFGYNTTAMGTYSTAMGFGTEAKGYIATSLGNNTIAAGRNTIAAGNSTKANAYLAIAFGRYNIGEGIGNESAWVETDPLLEIGNGTSDTNRTNALTILKNGTIIAPTFDLGEITNDKALITKEYADTNLVASGLETLDEGNGIGWRLKNQDPNNYGNIGLNAVDLSYSGSAFLRGATGGYSLATGFNTTAFGGSSSAFGYNTTAMGTYSTAMGFGTEAKGYIATSLGNNTIAAGRNTIAAGNSTKANAYLAIAFGRYNIGEGIENESAWVETDPLLEIGNGTSDTNRTNALTVLKNGTIIAPTFDLGEITDDKALITKEYADTNFDNSSGLEALNEGNGIGWRLKNQDPNNYGNIGLNAVDLSTNPSTSSTIGATGESSVALGVGTTAFGGGSVATGASTQAFGIASTASGMETVAIGNYSTAMGQSSEASGLLSIATGFQTTAAGDATFTMGSDTKADALLSIALGRFNIGGGNNNNWVETDPLFEVGNGTDDANRANALTILKNGKTGIGTANPNSKLAVNGIISAAFEPEQTNRIDIAHGGVNAYLNVAGVGRLDFRHEGVTGMTFTDTNRLGIGTTNPAFKLDVQDAKDSGFIAQIYNTSTNADADGLKIRLGAAPPNTNNYYVGFFGGADGMNGRIEGNGAGILYQTISDRRLKQDIKDVNHALDVISQIQPRTYAFKKSPTIKEYGFIAQELQPVYPQAVSGSPDSDVKTNPMMVDYSRLTPLLTAGIKELKAEMDNLLEKNKTQEEEIKTLKLQLSKFETLEAKLNNKETAYNTLNNRIEKLEALLITKSSKDVEVASNNND